MGKKSWQEKLKDSKELPKVAKISDKLAKKWGAGTVAIPAPIEIDEIMKKVPEGDLILRRHLAKNFLCAAHKTLRTT
jgi:hypothetical protein